MKKLLLVTQGDTPGPVTMDFAAYISKRCDADLRLAVVGRQQDKAQVPAGEDLLSAQAMMYTGQTGAVVSSRLSEKSIGAFQEACEMRDISGFAAATGVMTADDLIRETRFTDAVILDPEYTVDSEVRSPFPNRTDLKILHHAECPVIIAPPSFEPPDEVIFTYDGSRSSLHAIRQAMYMFPALRDKKLTVLQVFAAENEQPEDLSQLLGWLAYHFDTVSTVQLPGDSTSRLIEYLLCHPTAFVVMGGFGRGRVSRLFQPSTSETVVRLVSAPVFIAHN